MSFRLSLFFMISSYDTRMCFEPNFDSRKILARIRAG